jgi:anti-sigma factor RsiW
MNREDQARIEEGQLWRRYRSAGPRPSPECPGESELAGFIDGRLPPDRHDTIEAHMADCPECLDALIQMRALQAEAGPGPVVPASVRSAIAEVLPAVAKEQGRGPARAGEAPPALSFGGVFAWSLATAAAAAVICVAGSRIGRATVENSLGRKLVASRLDGGLWGDRHGPALLGRGEEVRR